MRKTVILDIDDTCGDLKERLQNIYRHATGNHEISFNDWADYNAKDRYGITSESLGQMFMDDMSLELMKPHEGLAEVTAILKSRDYNVEFVTARGWHPDGFNITKKWLDEHYVSYDKINIVPLFQCKEEATRDIGDVHLFVDDRADHCISMMKSGRVNKCLLYSQPWNAEYRDKKIWSSSGVDRNVEPIFHLYDILEYAP
jgi:uncharacterized HAD superfamily protein